LQIAAGLAVLSEPFLPFTSEKLKVMLQFGELHLHLGWDTVTTEENLLPEAHQLGKPELLFRKIEDGEIRAQLDKLEATKKSNTTENKNIMPQKDTISYEDFSKMDMRVGTVLEAEKMPKTKKLMVLKVDTGIDTRTIVSGIAEHFTAEEVVGKKVTVLVNLAPRPLRGVDSEGMILMTENEKGELIFLNPDDSGVINGATIS
ncbi:MAG: methionine--tRNA ligase subunit beta, partial [Flavobacteriaceae bacterium]|nr:methionine--tRNA ligase subunit beta [Flavobacteriaceae bacterium]